MKIAVGQLASFLRFQLFQIRQFLRGLINIGFAAAFLFQPLDNLRPEFGYIVRGQKTVVSLVHNIGNVVVKQGVHNFRYGPVAGQFVDIRFDTGV